MTEFQRALDQYLEGKLDGDSLDAALHRTLTASPDLAGELETKVRDLHTDDRIPERLCSTLLARVQHCASDVPTEVMTASNTGSDATAARVEADPTQESMVGTVFRERFVLESEIGRGGMGVVYCARDLRREEAGDLHNKVAIKVLPASLKDNPDAFIALQREAKRAQQLAHPNIVTVYDFDREGDVAYLCMELLKGKSLDIVMASTASHGLPLGEAMPIIQGMANGLSYAHERGIVHADFKPYNVFLTDQNIVKILDFGIARVITQPGTTQTVFDAGRLRAMTPAYASCEMFQWLDPDPRDDIYALACVTYELLAGSHPFANLAAPQARECKIKPKPIPGLSKHQNRALMHGLEFAREDRTPSVETFMEELSEPRRNATVSRIAISTGVVAATGAVGIAAWLFVSGDLPVTATNIETDNEPTAVVEPAPGSAEQADTESGEETADEKEPTLASAADPPPQNDTESVEKTGDEEPTSASNADPLPQDHTETGEKNTDQQELTLASIADQPPEPVDVETQGKIERILEIAGLHLASGRLVEPVGSNAAEAYAAVVELQPGNRESMKGLEAVAAGIEERALKLAQGDAKDEALEIINEGLKWIPDHPELTRLRDELQSP